MDMNFFTVLEALDRIYESDEKPEVEVFAEEAEDVADVQAQTDAEVVTDEAPADEAEPSQLVLKCENCGALVIKAEADVEIDEKTDLANSSESCEFCDEADGYTVIGTFAPYDFVEIVDDDDEDDAGEEESTKGAAKDAKAAEDEESGDAKATDDELEEFLDADINLSLDGGTGNDVNVL